MASVHEILTEQFRQWEVRGRGWRVFDEPVYLEPPFRPFYGHYLPDIPAVDDGRRPTILSSLTRKLGQKLSDKPTSSPIVPEVEQEPEPHSLVRDTLVELYTSLPAKLDAGTEAFEQFLRNLALCREPIAFELLGTAGRVSVQFVANQSDAPLVRRQLQAHFSDALFLPREGALEQAWESCEGDEILVVEFGLAREFMYELASGKLDPFVGLVGAMTELQPSDLALFQVLFQPVQEQWSESIQRSVTDSDGKPFFVNEPELTDAAENKIKSSLYAAVVRIAAKSESFERALQIAKDMAGSLRVFAQPHGNELIPLTNDDYPPYAHVEDMLRRQSRRSGMLLNSDELIGFVHLPSGAVRSAALERDSGKTKATPPIARSVTGLLLGYNTHAGQSVPVRLTPEQRVRHCHIIGASGTGKSTLLFNLIRQDIDNGEGLAVLDPHGDLVDKVLSVIPAHRIDDVVLVDPSDEEYSVGFNILSAHSELEKNLLASDLVSVFQRLSSSWGDQMQSVLQNAILAFLESDRCGTLADLRRFLIEPSFRSEFLESVHDPNVLYYWHKGFPHLSGNKSIGPILTRLEMLLAQKPIRHMVSQPENRLDFGQIMDTGKIFLAKLPEGLLGRENSYLLGALLVSKFQQMAMSRQAKQIAARRDCWIYVDEFANFITPSMAEILSGARKYRIGLTLAHHELHQLQRSPDVASAVMSHPFTRIVFRVGDDDAKKLAEGFAFFEPADLKNLETAQAICRVERSDFDFNLSVPSLDVPDETAGAKRRQEVITASREKYGAPRTKVEAMLREAWQSERPTAGFVRNKLPQVQSPVPNTVPITVQVHASETKVAEVPKTTVSESDQSARPDMEPSVVAVTQKPLRDLGKGGARHQAIQRRIKDAADTFGFRSVIEKRPSEGQESVDLLLERSDQKIACEISITTTIDHEVGNVQKCLRAGIPKIAIICVEEGRLRKISAAVSASLGAEAATRVSYYQPDQFIAYLKALPQPVPKLEETIRRGYKIKRSVPKLTPEEQRQREDIAYRLLAETMRKKP
ncbi:MAG TPA: type IV secretion system DNA-binding domain-containing protein [Verrucomicrobiae bacterium]|nr:type IV secretion system DNA-binding domain-containing protein [Verrucomicrobiae bacterium]